MAIVNPNFVPLPSAAPGAVLTAPSPASFSQLIVARDRQHALMTGEAALAKSVSFAIETGVSNAYTLTVRFPPSCLWADIGIYAYGKGTVLVTSPSDAVGTRWVVSTETSGWEHAAWHWSGGPRPSTDGADSGRAIQVGTVENWSWQSVDLTVDVSAVTTGLGILAVVVAPVLLPVTI